MFNALLISIMDKIAIPIWENRVSPVLDTAGCLLVVELDGKKENKRENYNLPISHIFRRAQYISELNVKIVLCGALSRPFYSILIESGINVYPWITGEIQEVLDAYIDGRLKSEQFILPGCRGRGRGRGQGRGRGRGNRRYRGIINLNYPNTNQEES